MNRIQDAEALLLWNRFAASFPEPVPFSFNPCLFSFYQNHFRWRPYYILLYHNNQLAGLLPLVFTGKAWVSLPHFSYGGILSKEKKFTGEPTEIIRQIAHLLDKMKPLPGFFRFNPENLPQPNRKAVKIFVRDLHTGDNKQSSQQKISSIMVLKPDTPLMWEEVNPNLRRKIGKAAKSETEWKAGGKELIGDFYRVYVRNICRLGSLPYDKKFFIDLYENYAHGTLRFFVAYREGRPVGSALLAAYQGFYENLFFATLPPFRKHYLSDGLHWQMIKFAIETQNTFNPAQRTGIYSFGRSTLNSSVHHYKSHWPVKDVALHYASDLRDVRGNRLLLNVSGFLPCFVIRSFGTYFIRHIY